MSSSRARSDCGCCAGIDASTPAPVSNPPGLDQIAYRVGRHGDFLESMRARLSSTDTPALAALGTRDASDFSLAIADALASTLDILAFYTERYTQEHYLRTATERRSVIDMARLIGYRPAPGVAAATHLAFTLKSVPGIALDPIVLPVGTKVQSVPGQDEQAQTFETVQAVPARAEWNAIPVQQSVARIPAFGDTSLWLDGIDAGLAVGDLLLIVGAAHEADPQDERWDVRTIARIDIDTTRKLTRVAWQTGLGHTKPFVLPADTAVRLYTFRKRTAVFGTNAPDWKVLGKEAKLGYLGVDAPGDAQSEYDAAEWPDFSALAPVYPEQRGSGASVSQLIAPTLAQVAQAATSAAQTAAAQAMQQAALAGTGVVMAGHDLASHAFSLASDSARAMADVAQLAANEVTQRVHTMLGAVQDTGDRPMTEVIGDLAANLPGAVAGAAGDMVFNAPSTVADAAGVLNPAEALQSLGDDASAVTARTRLAAEATLGAAAAADVAALVGTAVMLAQQLPAGLAPETPEALAAIARHFAGVGVTRAGGTPPAALASDAALTQIEAMLPANLQSAVEIGTPLMAMADNAEALANAPRHGALSAYQAIITQVDAALMGNFVAVTGKRQPLVRSPDTIDIMPVDDKVIAEGWALLSVPHSVELYRIVEAGVASRAEYLLAGQTTRLKLSGELPGGRLPSEFEHAPRTLAVHVQSDALALAREPLAAPVYGQTLALDHPVDGLAPGQAIALSGTRQRIRLARGVVALSWQGDDGSTRTLTGGDTLELVEAPVKLVPAPLIFGLLRYQPISLRLASRIGPGPSTAFTLKPLGPKILVFYTPYTLAPEDFVAAIGNGALRLRLKLRDRDGAVGTATLHGDDIALEAAHEDDEAVREIAFIAKGLDAITHTRDRTTVQLAEATRHVYVRLGTTVNANVAPATHGETVEAILGDGDGSRANQHFRLAQAPLTYVSAATPSGRASTLAVRVGDIRWEEADTLYDAAAHAHVFDTAQDDAAITTVRFGDGVEGARLPGGSSNVRARYRKGLGVAGNVAAGKLTTLLSRPLGVSEVLNPEAATGGEDAETLDKARDNAPLTVLTLDRAVSITDYADFARAFAGIDKAHALWIPAGPARGVLITIAGVDGAPVPTTSATYTHLLDALTEYGDPLVPIRLANYIDARFRTRIAVKVDPTHAQETVLAAIEAALNAHFGFARRAFGQTVSIDEVAAVAQAVNGVVAAHVSQLYRSGTPAEPNARLFAALPVASLTAVPAAAELLTLAEPGIALELMP